MSEARNAEVDAISNLQNRIEATLRKLNYGGDADSIGNIVHHLAEVAVMGQKLAEKSLPAFLELSATDREALADLIVDMRYELVEMKEAIEDMEPELLLLMNFLNK
ncbi:MAG TPA: hypothetical protein VJ731_03385 [Terriglobales bacterium]|nr:hypothetical protein [Terriglobales bacterium]